MELRYFRKWMTFEPFAPLLAPLLKMAHVKHIFLHSTNEERTIYATVLIKMAKNPPYYQSDYNKQFYLYST